MSLGSSFKRIFSKVGKQLTRTVSSGGVLLSLGEGLAKRFFGKFGEDVTDEISRVRKRITKQARRRVSTRSVERSVRRFSESELAEKAAVAVAANLTFGLSSTFGNFLGDIFSTARKQDRIRKGGLSGFDALKVTALDVARESVTALVTQGIGGAVGTASGAAGSQAATAGIKGASVSLFGDLLGGFAGIAKTVGSQVLKQGISTGTQVLTQRLAQSIGGGGRRAPLPQIQADLRRPRRNVDAFFGVPDLRAAGRGATGTFPRAERSSVARNGLTYSTVPFDERRLPARAFRDLPGGVKAGFVPGGQLYKPFQLETGEVVLREKKTRRMNPLNIKAATRAMRRIESLGRVIKRVRKITKKVKAI